MLITIGAAVMALRSARVQTVAVGILTEEIAKTLNIDAHIDRVDIRFPLAMYLDGVYLSDQEGDTLLSAPQLKIRFNPFAMEQNRLSFPLIQINDPTLQIKQDSVGSNVVFLVRVFSRKTSHQPFSYQVECGKIEVNNARVHYVHVPTSTDVLLTDIHTDIGLKYAGKDSLDACLRALHIKARVKPIDGYVEADFHGSLDSICADQMKLVYKGEQLFDGDVRVHHLLNHDSIYAQMNCTDLCADASLLSSLVSDIVRRPVQLPDFLSQLGMVHYRGNIEGGKNAVQVKGAFLSRVGSVSANLCLEDWNAIRGDLRMTNIALSHLLHNNDLGHLSANLTLDASVRDSIPVAKLKGSVSKFDYKQYTYSGIQVDADLTRDAMTGLFSVEDANIQMQVDAQVTNLYTSPKITAHADVQGVDLAQLHWTDSTLGQWVAFQSEIHLQVNSTRENLVDATMGTIQIDSVHVRGAGNQLHVPQVLVEIVADSTQRHLSITSDLLTAEVDGHFQWSTIPSTIKQYIHHSLPSLVAAPKKYDFSNNLEFKAQLLEADALLNVLGTNTLHFSSVPQLSGYIHEEDTTFALRVYAEQVVKNNTAYQDLLLKLNNDNPERNVTGSFYIKQHFIVQDSARLNWNDMMAQIQMVAHRDSLTTAFEFGPLDMADSVPDILVHSTIEQYKGKPKVDVHVMPSDFQLGRAIWHVDDAHLSYAIADTALSVHQLRFYTSHQMLAVDGKMSTHLNDSIQVEFKDLDLGYILSSTKVLDAIDFSGSLSGWATLYGAFSAPQFAANMTIPHAMINHADMGCITVKAELDRQKNAVVISGSSVKDSVHLVDLEGFVVATRPAVWQVDIDANGAPLDFINFWTKGIVDQVTGSAYGRVHIFGRNRRVWVATRAYAKDAAFTVPYTGCRYHFSDSVVLDTNYIAFPSIRLYDAEGHQGLVSGRIDHSNFKNFRYRLKGECTNLMGLNLSASSKSMYYGKAYATGSVGITGNEWMTRIDVDATTAANTDFYLSLATASDASSSEFITFRQPPKEGVNTTEQIVVSRPKSRFIFNLALDATPLARVHLVLDEHNGDGIVGRGEGSIRLNMDASTGDAQMLGTYTLSSGIFSYSVGNLIHRDFRIAEGSTVVWSGDPANPQLDIVAKYRCTASLRDLFGADVKSVTSRSSIPVDCVVRITGEMNNMVLKFGIEFPQSDESVAAQINAIINTEAMLMRQVVYLLVFNRFYTPENMRTVNTGINDAYSLLSSTVTGQINTWLSKLTSMVNVGFNMRANVEQGNQSYETEANIQIQPVDRLTINGNLGYRYNDISNQPIFGDADVEYELTADGKLRAKVFTHSVDKYSLHQTGMQEGIGFIFRHDFNPGDAKNRREQKKAESSK